MTPETFRADCPEHGIQPFIYNDHWMVWRCVVCKKRLDDEIQRWHDEGQRPLEGGLGLGISVVFPLQLTANPDGDPKVWDSIGAAARADSPDYAHWALLVEFKVQDVKVLVEQETKDILDILEKGYLQM